MNLNKLEQNILIKFFQTEKIKELNQYDLNKIKIKKRINTEVGFITYIEKTELLKVMEQTISLKWGKLGAKINNSIDVGFLIYIDEGYLTTIEGYTYDVKWPDKIENLEFYLID